MSQEVLDLVLRINQFVLNPIIGLLFGLALVVFLWGLVEYFFESNQEIAREKGKRHIIWGIFGMFIMFAVFALIRIIAGEVGADPGALRVIGP